ncbi:MAG: hypothetical protein M0Q14_06395 [Tissierellaceae bacterium]|nr:hypothetical protein [Tissierellaceae bacterium]
MGEPRNKKYFEQYKSGDIDVYVYAGMRAQDDRLRVSFGKILWMKSLAVDGLIL